MNRLSLVAAIAILAVSARAEDISGTIQISKKLTKRSVTASIPVYARGTAVKLGKENDEDPFAYERSRVVIYLEGAEPADAGPRKLQKFAVAQQNREFTPDIIAVPAGSSVAFPNLDPIFHNIFSLSKPKSFDLGSYDKGESRNVVFNTPGIVYVYCHLHPNMSATIVVTPNRWYAQSDGAGHYRIPNVPPGKYTIVAWHKAAGFFRRTIVVEPDHDAIQDFNVPIPDDQVMKTSAMEDMAK